VAAQVAQVLTVWQVTQLARVQGTQLLPSWTWPVGQTQVLPCWLKPAGHWQAPLTTTKGELQVPQVVGVTQV